MSLNLHHYNLAHLFDEVLATHAAKPALRYIGGSHTYFQLGGWIESLAVLLMAKGLKRGDVIAIGNDKHPLSYALMLAALRLGVAYVNIDIASPIARTSHILQASDPKLLCYDNSAYENDMSELAMAQGCELLLLDYPLLPSASEVDREGQRQCSRFIDGSTIAYIMFTSGSTGVPKGVAVTHQNVLHFISWGKSRFGITGSDNFANLNPMYFDNSVFDFYVGLFSGAILTPVRRELLTSPYELVDFVKKMGCSIWFSVPSLLIYLVTMKALSADVLPALRAIIFGGEGYPKVELKKLFDYFYRQADLVNVYGPTECTCICSAHSLCPEDFNVLDGLPTLGHLNPNFDYRILDEDETDTDYGELCLIGPNVAAGYFNDTERTRAAFFTLTECNRFMKRMYRTGDIVREESGKLYFVGRKDNQIKHMGYRIELEEVELGLVRLPKVNQAAVIYQRSSSAYGKLIGFVASSELVDDKALIGELRRFLPEYMIPNKLIVMEKLPINQNGKVDRHQLRTAFEKIEKSDTTA